MRLSFSNSCLVPLLGLSLALTALAGCGGFTSQADQCWGSGSASGAACTEAKSHQLGALLLTSAVLPSHLGVPGVAEPSCGASFACPTEEEEPSIAAPSEPVVSPPSTPVVAESNTPQEPEPDVTPAPPAAPAELSRESRTINRARTRSPSTEALVGATPKLPVGARTGGMKVGSVSGRDGAARAVRSPSVVPPEEPAEEPKTDSEVQVAALEAFNTRERGWKKAVGRALQRPGLKNSPLLNFAGINPAYNSGRYSLVLHRARIVWKNLGKGYQLGSKERGFLLEYSCRSAGQLALSGKPANDGLDWCERWLDHAERSGQSTAEAQNLIDELE